MSHNMIKSTKRLLIVASLTISFILICPYKSFAKPLKAGVISVNITRDNPTTLINDPLYAKILVLDDGSTRAVIITTDLIKIEDTLLREIRNRIQEELKIDTETEPTKQKIQSNEQEDASKDKEKLPND